MSRKIPIRWEWAVVDFPPWFRLAEIARMARGCGKRLHWNPRLRALEVKRAC